MGMLCHVKRVKDTIIGACRMQNSFNLLGVLPDKMKNTKWRRWEHDEFMNCCHCQTWQTTSSWH